MAELRSEHPLGKAVVRCYQAVSGNTVAGAEDFQMLPGRGVVATIAERRILAGNAELLQANDIPLTEQCHNYAEDYLQKGCTIIYVAIDGALSGLLALSDTLRPEAAAMIPSVKKTEIFPVLLTGDHENAARHMAKQLDIQEVYANCLPENKLQYIAQCQQMQQQVCMVGDGINDAPALKKSLCWHCNGRYRQRYCSRCG